ncbi:MAG: anti-sigma factor, partial [Burkholderiales bacterium]|nr:anti-sigma factor [Burkholderiales bacterium]
AVHGGGNMKTYWHQHPETVERLAAEYALGTLPAAARRRLETLMRDRQDIAQAVWSWHDTLSGALVSQAPLPVDLKQWHRLESRLFAPAAASTAQTAQRAPWWFRWFAPLPSGMLALGLTLGLALPTLLPTLSRTWQSETQSTQPSTQLPESYVGVLATRDGQAGLIVSSLRKGLQVDIKQQTPVEVPKGQTLYLWLIDKAGQAHAVAPIPNGRFVSLRLNDPAETTFQAAVELAVSLEPQGGAPTQASGAFVYRGLCGKIWKPPLAPR